jgi:hypothetical protein
LKQNTLKNAVLSMGEILFRKGRLPPPPEILKKDIVEK